MDSAKNSGAAKATTATTITGIHDMINKAINSKPYILLKDVWDFHPVRTGAKRGGEGKERKEGDLETFTNYGWPVTLKA